MARIAYEKENAEEEEDVLQLMYEWPWEVDKMKPEAEHRIVPQYQT